MRIHAPASRLFPHRTKRSPQHCAVDHATLVDYRFGGVSIEQVDRYCELICDQMNFPGDLPAGLLLHVAGPVGDVWRVTSVWRDAAQSREFFEKRLIPAVVEVVREHQGFPEIRPRDLHIHLFAVNKRLIDVH